MIAYFNKDYCQIGLFAGYRITTSRFSVMERRHRHTVHATLSLTCAPMCPSSLNWITDRQSGHNSCGLFSVGVLQQMMMLSQNFRHLPAELHADRLFGSAKPGDDALNRAIVQLPKDWWWLSRYGYHVDCWILSGLAVCANDRYCFTTYWVKIEKNPCTIVKFGVISRGVNIYAN